MLWFHIKAKSLDALKCSTLALKRVRSGRTSDDPTT
ncbi:hypothetical protein J2Z48_001913 [Croceifilum oryzae]|uniref:Uncharacterized protein n=1 Tax=Croceifilum oryzae TaxID=1553429 RepID=A0AAJ1TF18_9BACL|nr:hypothetical protein [Croceifilum oryzae]